MVALNPCLAALASFYTSELLEFAVKLLNFPAHAAHLLYDPRVILSQVISHDKFRAVGRNRHPEKFHFFGSRKPTNFDEFTLL